MKVLINNYRGIDITFDTERERFSCSLDGNENWSEKQSYAAVTKAIDDYYKDTANFNPFYIRTINSGELKVVGQRKDGRYVVEKNSKPEQLSTYEEGSYFIYNPSEEHIYAQYAMNEAEIATLVNKRNKIIESIKSPTLNEYKKQNSNHE
jgi:hypothetical protein